MSQCLISSQLQLLSDASLFFGVFFFRFGLGLVFFLMSLCACFQEFCCNLMPLRSLPVKFGSSWPVASKLINGETDTDNRIKLTSFCELSYLHPKSIILGKVTFCPTPGLLANKYLDQLPQPQAEPRQS